MTRAGDWPQWRGPERDGVVAWEGPQPEHSARWPDALTQGFRVELGEGHSSPVVVDGRIFQFSRQGDSEVLRALSLDDGRTIWEAKYPAPYRMNPAATGHGKGPKSSPSVADGRVFTLGIDGIVSCYDAEAGGLIWQNDFRNLFRKMSPLYGHGMSPIVIDGKLILHIGGDQEGALVALDAATGAMRWHHQGDGPGYASPIVVERAGKRQVVTQTDAHIVGHALETGARLWRIPFTTPYTQNIVTPIAYDDLLIFAGLQQQTIAVSLTGGEPKVVWKNSLSFYMSTPVLLGQTLFGLSDKRSGHFVAIDANSGETTFAGEPRQGDNAAIVVAGEWILALTDDAALRVLPAATQDFAPIRTYTVADAPTWAHPVPTPAGILIKDATRLTLWRVA